MRKQNSEFDKLYSSHKKEIDKIRTAFEKKVKELDEEK